MGRIVTDRNELRDLLAAHKQAGRKVVLANGCFDLIHVGHTRCLHDAKRAGDVLVVALNTDESVRAGKGPGRPLMPLDERLELIAALADVDYVTAFAERTVDDLILAIQPDFQAKGTEYTNAHVPEKDAVESYGGKLIFCGDPKSHSTTDLVDRLARLAADESQA